MRRTLRTLALLACIPAFAVAGPDEEPIDPRGELLLQALPDRADLVVHTPDLPALLAAASEDGLGTPQAWRAAFEQQLRAWGERSGRSDELRKAGLGLLKAADGEALVASMPLPAIGGPERATVLAFRSTRTAAQMKALVVEIIKGGLTVAYPGEPQTEEIQGRSVIALAGVDDRLYVTVQDGFVAASDHPLALGLLFRGLETAGEIVPHGPRLLTVRHGRGVTAWSGWIYGERESVSWKAEATEPVTAPIPAGCDLVAAIAVLRPEDLPIFPAPAPLWTRELPVVAGNPILVGMPRQGGMLSAGVVVEGVEPPGIDTVPEGQAASGAAMWTVVRGPTDLLDATAAAAAEPVRAAGATSRLGWLRAWASGRIPAALPELPAKLFLGPLTSASEASEGQDALVLWTGTDQPGELRGPRTHGPTTLLALRTLYAISTKSRPGDIAMRRSPRAPLPPKAGGSPLPDPTAPRELPPPEPDDKDE